MTKLNFTIGFLIIHFLLLVGCQKDAIQEEATALASIEKKSNVNANMASYIQVGQGSQVFTEKRHSYLEKMRTGVNYWYWTDFEPTGFYLPADTTLTIDVQHISGGNLPVLLIGTYYLRTNSQMDKKPREIQLHAGKNVIPSDKSGGILWIRYHQAYTSGESSAKIDFLSGHKKMPIFIRDQTSSQTFKTELITYQRSSDVLLVGKNVYQVYNRDAALRFSQAGQDFNYVLRRADDIWDLENEIFGLDGSAPEHMPNAHNKCLMVEEVINYAGAYAYFYGTAYSDIGFNFGFAQKDGLESVGGIYLVSHEMGHLHQQSAFTWKNMQEVTNLIFTDYVFRKLNNNYSMLLKGTPRRSESVWPYVMEYLNSNDADKNFLENVVINPKKSSYADHIRLAMFWQLRQAFGDEFLIQLHKRSRTDGAYLQEDSSDADKMEFFMLTACKISGRDLSNFFREWGFKVGQPVYDKITQLNLPAPDYDITLLRE